MSDGIERRKADHLDLCATDDVAFKSRTTLLEHVKLVHQSLPDLAESDVDLSVEILGKKLRAPIVIAGMTGGTERAYEVNRDLATLAEELGYAFGLGSQRAMHVRPDTRWTFRVREHAPSALLLGNLGVVQAREMAKSEIEALIAEAGADALCVHMNPAMELVQPGGDRDFRGGTETFSRLARELGVPVIAKETGNGISRETARKLREAGITHVDVSGAGGTSWVGVETLRAEGDARALGETLWDWGIPTAAAVHYAASEGHVVIATGGMHTGLDAARAIALGATAAGFARHVFQAQQTGGIDGARQALMRIERELRAVALLCGARSLRELREVPRVITGELRDWLA